MKKWSILFVVIVISAFVPTATRIMVSRSVMIVSSVPLVFPVACAVPMVCLMAIILGMIEIWFTSVVFFDGFGSFRDTKLFNSFATIDFAANQNPI